MSDNKKLVSNFTIFVDNYNIDKQGFLLDFDSWDIGFCNKVANDEKISLTDEHMLVISFLRDFYQQNKKSPAIRELVKALKEKHGEKIGNSLYLQVLFPVSPAVASCKTSRPSKTQKMYLNIQRSE